MMIALLQINLTIGDLTGNADRIIAAVKRSATAGAELCFTSELALFGYPPHDLLLYRDITHKTKIIINDLAFQLRHLPPLILGAPGYNTDYGMPLYNCAFVLEKGYITNRYAKQRLSTYGIFNEHYYFAPGTDLGIVWVAGLTLGLTISEDIWNDKNYYNSYKLHYIKDIIESLVSHDLDAIVNISASPFIIGKQIRREAILSDISRKYNLPLVYINQVGGNDNLIFDGRSAVFDSQGRLQARGAGFIEDTILVKLDTRLSKKNISLTKDSGIAIDDFSPPAEAWNALILGTRDYTNKCGFACVLLGLSGGIDSSLVAAIATAALGPDRVLGVIMPSPYSSLSSIEDAKTLAKNLGITTYIMPILDCMQAFDRTLASIFIRYKPDLIEENLQTRIRSNLLMALSNKFNALLLNTGNKSELSVGYCTIYGDMCGGLAVIADIPKTLVYDICHYLNIVYKEVIPVTVLTKVPSAELRFGQQDQDLLPPYDLLDTILEQYIDNRTAYADLITAGFDPTIVTQVLRMIYKAEFKRRQAAPRLIITDRTLGMGWRIPLSYYISI